MAAKLPSLRVRKRGALSQEATELKSGATIVNLFANLCPQIAAEPSIFEENSDYPNSFCKKKRSNPGDRLGVFGFKGVKRLDIFIKRASILPKLFWRR